MGIELSRVLEPSVPVLYSDSADRHATHCRHCHVIAVLNGMLSMHNDGNRVGLLRRNHRIGLL